MLIHEYGEVFTGRLVGSEWFELKNCWHTALHGLGPEILKVLAPNFAENILPYSLETF